MDIKSILTRLAVPATGHFDNHFYIIKLENSDEYAKYYSLLSEKAINTEEPSISTNTNNNITKLVNYFEITDDSGITYNIFLIADFESNSYLLKIGEKT